MYVKNDIKNSSTFICLFESGKSGKKKKEKKIQKFEYLENEELFGWNQKHFS